MARRSVAMPPLSRKSIVTGLVTTGPSPPMRVLACAAMPRTVVLSLAAALFVQSAQSAIDARPAYRYRVAIASLLQLKPGMSVAEIGPGAGFLSKVATPQLEPGGLTTTSDSIASLEKGPYDAIALLDAFTAAVRPEDAVRSVTAALRPGGVLLVVDVPREGVGAAQLGIDAEELIALAIASGLKRDVESGIVPGHFAIRFRKPS